MSPFSNVQFHIRKMQSTAAETVQYKLGDVELNPLLGKDIKLEFTGNIQCMHCSRSVKKTFFDGYCYPCFQSLARCDMCILKPELCHFAKGTCREPEWGKENCLIDHVVYLSLTSALKVGITRAHKKLERWVDQGAVQAIILAKVPERLVAGQVEILLAKAVSDKTDWRHLILGKIADVDLMAERLRISSLLDSELGKYLVDFNVENQIYNFKYPILEHPQKVKSHNFDKEAVLEGPLRGIKGQYLFVGEKVVNMRKYGGYQVNFGC